FVAAYEAGTKVLRAGVTTDQVYAAWSNELVRRRSSLKSAAARQATDEWSKRQIVPYWQIHTIHLLAGNLRGPPRAEMTIAFEPIASIGEQGYYLEDMFLIKTDGAELLTPGVPYTADQIEAAMRRQ